MEEDLPSHEILRENLKRKTRGKRKSVFTEPKCDICGKVYADKQNLARHMLIHTDNLIPCPHCSYQAKTKMYLSRHVKRVHGGPPTKNACGYCGKTFHFKTNLLNHERVHTGAKPYKCEVCGKDFSARYSLITHKLIHTDEKPFKCPYCEYACRDSSTLRKHRERHLGIVKSYACELCDLTYTTKARLNEHVQETHAGLDVRKHKCTQCKSAFKQRAVLTRHIESVHKRTMTCVCPVCGVTLSTHHNLKGHMRSHLDERPFTCAAHGCGRSFKDKQTLKKHSLIHDMAAHVICDVCGKTFSRKRRLELHLKQHLPRVKGEECGLCGDKFYTKRYLVKHVRQKHARKRQKFVCDMCDFETHNKPSIVMHIKYGHNVNKGKCQLCGKAYKRNQHLRLHYWNTHGVRFKTNARMVVLPEQTEVKIKEEPPEPVADLEVDLLEIEKEEPFAGFESSENSQSSVLPAPWGRGNRNEQTLQQFLASVIHDPETVDIDKSDSTIDIDNATSQKLEDKQTAIDNFVQKQQTNKLNKYFNIDVEVEENPEVLEDVQQNTSKEECKEIEKENVTVDLIDDEQAKMDKVKQINTFSYSNKVTSATEEDNTTKRKKVLINTKKASRQKTSKKKIKEQLATSLDKVTYTEEVVTDKQESRRIEETQEQNEVLDQLSVERMSTKDSDSQTSDVNETTEDTRTEVVQEEAIDKVSQKRSSMGVEEFIQNVIGNTEADTKDESMVVDQVAEVSVQKKLRKLLIKMKRTASGKKGVLRDHPHRLKVFTPEEIEEIKNKKETEETQEDNKEVDDKKEDGEKKELPSCLKMIWDLHQCYVCFKVFDTKPKLIDHCKSHFDVCNETTLKKCPLCSYVTTKSDIKKHLRIKHKQSVSISFMDINDRKDNSAGSRYYYDTKNENIKQLEIIPSIKILNKKASMELDKKNREFKNKFVGKNKLVRKGDEWIVVKEKLDISNHVLPDCKDLDRNAENYLEVIKKLGAEAKRKGVKMLYPCNKCDKVCQNLSALTLHTRRHDPNKKPFKPRGSIIKAKEKRRELFENAKVNPENRLAKPKPIVNNHKCDPKLMDFYEKNIKGGDIEFWQFLKIYNKMDREKVNSFEDLESRTEFGIHYDNKITNSNDEQNDAEIDFETLSGNKKGTGPKKVSSHFNDVPEKKDFIGDRKFVRTIRLTKVEYNKRQEIKNRMRQNLQKNPRS